MENPSFSLYQLNAIIHHIIEEHTADEYWLHAELSEVRVNAAGHCYLEFIEKHPHGNTLLAKARGVVWSNVYRLMAPYFERETGQVFASGIKVLVKVRPDFHELFGYTLTVLDIDPTFTLGDMVRRRREILNQLEVEGVLTLNKELPMPQLPKRVAVISSTGAAGYGDFCRQLLDNTHGYVFYTRLFPAVMQGEKVEQSICAALDDIYADIDSWDVVVIIRGGGAVSDLSGFDTYLLASSVAQFPIPIITGIGHERDDTVIDIVSHTRVKTPTAAAEFLINRMHEAESRLDEVSDYIRSYVLHRLETEEYRLMEIARRLPGMFTVRRIHEERRHELLWQRTLSSINLSLTTAKHRLQLVSQRAEACDIQNILARGYTLTLKDGRIVTDATQLSEGDHLLTRFSRGEVHSVVFRGYASHEEETSFHQKRQRGDKD